MTWTVERLSGRASLLHGRSVAVPAARTLSFLEPTDSVVVLGRAQKIDVADERVVRRASGGGAVWVAPGAQVWADIVIPRGDSLWRDDVNEAAWWVGDAWGAALTACGIDGVEVHRGAMACGPWGPTVCFAGIGAGEVTVGGRKAVGVAQRRTRDYALFQCAVPVTWEPDPIVVALGLPAGAAEELAGGVWSVREAGADPASVGAALVDALPA